MKIVGGTLRGRQFAAPPGSVSRPMSGQVREALFNIAGDISGQAVLDVYAGSGAIGFEALSRGAGHVIGIEKARSAAKIIDASLGKLNLNDHYRLLTGSVERTIGGLATEFNMIVADPPYSEIDWTILDKLGELLADGGIFAVSHSSRLKPAELQSVKRIDTRIYGDTALSFYK